MKIKCYKQENGRWVLGEDNINFFRHWYNSIYVVWNYLLKL